jgi:prepilin-type N-terminal cleavage/methylation domain-containing protein
VTVLVAIQQLRSLVGTGAVSAESGFTLVELLIVMLVAGILATIAIPAFGDSASKARDARAKETAHYAYTAMQTCAAESLTGYAGCNAAALRALDPTLPGSPTLKVNGLAADAYTIVVQSNPPSQKFKVKLKNGLITFPCTKKDTGGCPHSADWG